MRGEEPSPLLNVMDTAKKATGLVHNPGKCFQRLQSSIDSVGHVGTEIKEDTEMN